ncbi:MAG: putative lipoprotein [Acidobacteria bacterium]|nr:putative lipoprotein [Acidobacteriota bacterium]
MLGSGLSFSLFEAIKGSTMSLNRMHRRLFLAIAAAFLTLPVLAQHSNAIYEVKSQYQTIAVWDSTDGQRRQLLFDPNWNGTDSIQSEMNKSNPNELVLDYTKHMIASVPLVDKPKRILIVGLGGASLQRYLHNLLPDTVIESAELDPVVLEIAREYFYFIQDDRQKVHIGDGREFMEKSQEKYDIIMLDAFSATSIPYRLSTQEFLQRVKERLSKGGIVCANLWSHQADYPDMLKTYATVFPELHVLPCRLPWSNHILIAMPAKQMLTVKKWKEKAVAFDKAHPTGLNLIEFVERHITPQIQDDARVLLDKDAPND